MALTRARCRETELGGADASLSGTDAQRTTDADHAMNSSNSICPERSCGAADTQRHGTDKEWRARTIRQRAVPRADCRCLHPRAHPWNHPIFPPAAAAHLVELFECLRALLAPTAPTCKPRQLTERQVQLECDRNMRSSCAAHPLLRPLNKRRRSHKGIPFLCNRFARRRVCMPPQPASFSFRTKPSLYITSPSSSPSIEPLPSWS